LENLNLDVSSLFSDIDEEGDKIPAWERGYYGTSNEGESPVATTATSNGGNNNSNSSSYSSSIDNNNNQINSKSGVRDTVLLQNLNLDAFELFDNIDEAEEETDEIGSLKM